MWWATDCEAVQPQELRDLIMHEAREVFREEEPGGCARRGCRQRGGGPIALAGRCRARRAGGVRAPLALGITLVRWVYRPPHRMDVILETNNDFQQQGRGWPSRSKGKKTTLRPARPETRGLKEVLESSSRALAASACILKSCDFSEFLADFAV